VAIRTTEACQVRRLQRSQFAPQVRPCLALTIRLSRKDVDPVPLQQPFDDGGPTGPPQLVGHSGVLLAHSSDVPVVGSGVPREHGEIGVEQQRCVGVVGRAPVLRSGEHEPRHLADEVVRRTERTQFVGGDTRRRLLVIGLPAVDDVVEQCGEPHRVGSARAGQLVGASEDGEHVRGVVVVPVRLGVRLLQQLGHAAASEPGDGQDLSGGCRQGHAREWCSKSTAE
jgi:hypothetical protein